WQATVETKEKQQWVVLVDDSGSMALADVNGESRFKAARADLEQIREAAGSRVQLSVQTLSGRPLGDEPGQGPSRFREALTRAGLSRQRPDRIVFLTDGRDSEGRDPKSLGEELRRRDVRLSVKVHGSPIPPVSSTVTAEPERNALRLGEEVIIRGAVSSNRGGDETVLLKENGK